MNQSMHVVFGAGPLGKAVAEEVVRQGGEVRIVNKSGIVPAGLPESVRHVQGDAGDAEQVLRICKDADVVYNCMGLPYTQWNRLPGMMEGLIEGVGRSGSNAVLVYGDNLYAYGVPEGKLTENSSSRPVGWKTALRAQMADRLMAAHRQGEIRATIGRGASFYGPGVLQSILGAGVFDSLLAGKPAAVLGNIDAKHSMIYIRDFARGLVTLGASEQALGHIWHIPADRAASVRELTNLAAAHLGKEPKFRVATRPILTLLGIFSPMMKEMKELFYQYDRPFVMDDSKFRSTFGAVVTPHEEAIRTTLDWYMSDKRH